MNTWGASSGPKTQGTSWIKLGDTCKARPGKTRGTQNVNPGSGEPRSRRAQPDPSFYWGDPNKTKPDANHEPDSLPGGPQVKLKTVGAQNHGSNQTFLYSKAPPVASCSEADEKTRAHTHTHSHSRLCLLITVNGRKPAQNPRITPSKHNDGNDGIRILSQLKFSPGTARAWKMLQTAHMLQQRRTARSKPERGNRIQKCVVMSNDCTAFARAPSERQPWHSLVFHGHMCRKGMQQQAMLQ